MNESGGRRPINLTPEQHKKMTEVRFGWRHKKNSGVREAESIVKGAFADWTEAAGISSRRMRDINGSIASRGLSLMSLQERKNILFIADIALDQRRKD
ncbi:MAG: hypothetical protein WAW80_04555 [Candidatus Saccharimonadales bacterium]